jgi:GT2 family glycosyltransferase
VYSYVIILNWNGWRDTIECLESVLRQDYESFRVIVCDNESGDQSLDRIAEWAQGGVAASCSAAPQVHQLISPPVAKPVRFLRIDAGERIALESRRESLFLVQTGGNLGFSGGNNVGLRLALGAGDLEYAWLLNNDTVAHPQALSTLVAEMRNRPDVGICGSKVLYYHAPQTVQALGGSTYNHWTGRGACIGRGRALSEAPSQQEVEQQMQLVFGASMFVRRSFLEYIGLLDERYFLYFEENDWAARARGRFNLGYCPKSVVYHKEGASIGSSEIKGKPRSELSERFASRSRILFTRIHYPAALVTVLLAMLMSALHRLTTGRVRNFFMLVRGGLSGLVIPLNSPQNQHFTKN